VPITFAHPSFIPWWQELHDHIFNMPVHPLCLQQMPNFQPTSEVICSSPFLTSVSIILLFTYYDSVIFCGI
jgi:hypothetical protein